MLTVSIIGMGPGNLLQQTQEAVEAIAKSDYLIGDKRILKELAFPDKTQHTATHVPQIMELMKEFLTEGRAEVAVAVLVSGDVGFYSLAKSLLRALETENITDLKNVRLICGIGSLQYFSSKIKTAWDDAAICSLHGREGNIVGNVLNNRKVFVLTGGDQNPAAICRKLSDFGLAEVKVSIGENLSYPNERIVTGTAQDFTKESFASLSVMMIENPAPLERAYITHGLPDEWFIRGDVPMTKQEVRAVSLSKLRLRQSDITYDIGAGTGSVSLEMALQQTHGFVYAIEKNEQAVALIHRNKEQFGAKNLIIITNTAPEGIAELPPPDRVFIGGSGGNLKEILDTVYAKNNDAGIVINAITLETLNEAMAYYRDRTAYEVELVQVTVARSRKLADYHLLMGQNPVFVLSAWPAGQNATGTATQTETK
ncbi:precorrin-6y C5,15-methyltransferase (decarboxylating) subunit CbiE [Dehalobacter sp. DCM]|uniref:precorrin-6y C5,15-methyltransferase (decarboxylating) subunit CbiE n=1 Tax=Dehalobacter sp. DCM TaxID=2907827 RepID=UPI003081E654|nr:precorrin-6y C5,15-methyltransferase (decarboxylating) subunit CbiE [Dehalobacter sp. DCM]